MTAKVGLKILGQPDPNVPKDVHLVGRYALGVDWADNHGSTACGVTARVGRARPSVHSRRRWRGRRRSSGRTTGSG